MATKKITKQNTNASRKKITKNSPTKIIKPLVKKKNPLSREVTSILSVSLGILMVISLFFQNSTGYFGAGINGILFGMFGIGAYLLPFMTIGMGIYFFIKKDEISISKIIMTIILFICFISLVSIATVNFDYYYSGFTQYLTYFYENGSSKNGGLIGGFFGKFLYVIFGKAGASVVFLVCSIVSIMLMTGKSSYKIISNIYSKLTETLSRDNYDEDDEEYEEENIADFKQKLSSKTRSSFKNSKKAPMFIIEEKKKDKNGDTILLVREDSGGKEKKVILLKDCKNKNILDIVNMDKGKNHENQDIVSEIEHPIISDIDIKVNGINMVEDDRNFETKELYVPSIDDSEGKKSEEKYIETGSLFDEIYLGKKANEDKLDKDIVINEKINLPDNGARDAKPLDINSMNFSQNNSQDEPYIFPNIEFLNKNPATGSSSSRSQILENSRKLEETLKSFGVEAKVIEVSKGPAVTRYELSPGQGVKVSKISNLADDLALNLAAVGIRIEAPIPGKAAVGIEIPNKEVTPVYLREVLDDDKFRNFPSKLAFALGKDIAGNIVVADIAKMPHLLIAGATGSGKSVCVNTLITSIIYKASPGEVKLLMIDPKVVELSIYNGIPHLLIPVVTDPKKAAGALNWAVHEMITRYNLFAEASVKNLKGYNTFLKENGETNFLPQIVIIIDELADLMMAAPGEVEDAICRLAQMARAAGLHLIIATQRPSVDVITGLIKANVPSRLAFSVSSGIDSRTILDMVGAEKLMGKGDMLFCPMGMGKPLRVQGAFVSEKEVEKIVSFVKKDATKEYDQEMIDKITATKNIGEVNEDVDEFFEAAVEFIIEKDKASASLLQRQFRIGYNRASRLIEDLEARGIVGPEDGSKPRKILMTSYQWNEWKNGKS